jgi:hypothetical protein
MDRYVHVVKYIKEIIQPLSYGIKATTSGTLILAIAMLAMYIHWFRRWKV